ncbi:hypothetical protein Taro_029878 [Colocasia esculenta]|uniref:RRM domain-containing protein n=1 Tax=Colocasia esculenta TaxID=4460 RepID=A0A843VEX5_COLES|nr:hypothetical protein [Colocasia esculenta]
MHLIFMLKVVDCRICGDPHSVLRFAFIEFADEQGARAALNLGGTVLGYYPVRVLPSKTAILPVNPTFLPRSEDEREMCARTVYCTNIDKKVCNLFSWIFNIFCALFVTQTDVKAFFEAWCGEVSMTCQLVFLFMNTLKLKCLQMSSKQVSRLRLLGDHAHSTRIAFVEFILVSIHEMGTS